MAAEPVVSPSGSSSSSDGASPLTSVLVTAIVSAPDQAPTWRDVIARFRADARISDLRATLAGTPPAGAEADGGLLVDGRYVEPATLLVRVLRHGALVAPRSLVASGGGERRVGGHWEVAVVGGLWSGATASLDAGPVVVGRAADAGLHIDDPDLSRTHARFTASTGAAITVRDAGSTNGTRVRGVRVESAELAAGDIVEVGASVLTVRPVPRAE